MPLLFNDPSHWRERAAEARKLAAGMTDPEGRGQMLDIAKSYDKLAERALTRLSESAKSTSE